MSYCEHCDMQIPRIFTKDNYEDIKTGLKLLIPSLTDSLKEALTFSRSHAQKVLLGDIYKIPKSAELIKLTEVEE